MANSAPYEVNITGTDDETFSFAFSFVMTDGTAFPWDEYTFEYVVKDRGAPALSLSEGSGIFIDPPKIEFRAAQKLRRGTYSHGCRVRHVETGEEIQVFSGTVTITQGNF